jgi:EmrB/QacA subfamily drug resistance transporter
VLAIASLGSAVAFVDATIVNIAFPDMARSFKGTSVSNLSWVLSAYNIVFAAFLVAAGRIADLLGRRRLFVFGLELFTFASLLCALAPSANALIAFRVLQALGAACLVPSSLALVLNAFPPERRSHGVALLSAAGAAAAGLGPSLGGVLVAVANWRLVFLVNIPIGIAAVVLAKRRLVESRTPGRRRMPDIAGAALFALAIASLVLGIVKGQDWGWLSAPTIVSFAVAIAVGAVFLWRCTWHRSPIIDLGLLRIRTFSTANAMTVVGAAGFYGYTLANVLFLTGVWRYTVLQAGLAVTIGPFVAVAVAVPASRLVERVGHRPVLVFGGLLWGGAVLWFVERAGLRPDFLGVWLPGMVLLGIGAGALFPNLSGAAVASAPGESYATATGMNAVARQVGAALGIAIVVAILGTPTPLTVMADFRHAWTFGAVALIVAGLGCLLVGRLDIAKAPALADAARAVFGARRSERAQPPMPRARRAITVAPAETARTRIESTADFLARVPIFAGIGAELRAKLADNAGTRRLGPGDWLFRQGDLADAMYVVRAGRLEVIDDDSGAAVRELGRGDALGELALLTDDVRSASARAARATDLIVIGRTEFEELLDSTPALSLALNRSLSHQLRVTRAPTQTVRPRPTTVALVSLGRHDALPQLAARLALALRRHVSVAVLTGAELPPPAAGSEPATVYGPLLDRAETSHDLVFLVGGSALEENHWSRFCLQQADRILAVTRGGPVPDGLAERADLRGCELVLHEPRQGEIVGWAAAIDPIESHLVRTAELTSDLARVARRLTGNATGIVLSGGGARAFCHIGVLEELTAAGVVIDRIAGVSMGAWIAGLFAIGLDADAMDRVTFEEWVQRRPLSDYTIPRHALIRGERVRAMVQRAFGKRLVEELPLNFWTGITELRSGTLVIARQGLLWEAVGFSMCLPLLAPPQVRGRQLFIDGALRDNLPMAPMAALGEGPIIAVDVKATTTRTSNGRVDSASSADGPRIPSLGEMFSRVLLLGAENTSAAAERHADLVIRPQTPGIGLLEFHQLDAAREAGRIAAREALARSPDALFAAMA